MGAVPKLVRLVGLAVLFAALPQTSAWAQARTTASKSTDVTPFGGFVYLSPDYGPQKNKGEMLGLDITHHFGWPVAPSLEVRANRGAGPTDIERSVLVGLKAQGELGRFHPYADFLVGGGTIVFVIPIPNYHADRSTVYSYGGGLDYDLPYHLQAKVDFQGQKWNLGIQHPFPLTPQLLSVGVAYRIPFRPHNRQSDGR